MTVRAQYPVFGRRTPGFDVRQKWFTVLFDEIRKRIPTSLLRLLYVPSSPATHPFYRFQMRFLEDRSAVTHIITNMHSFLLRRAHLSPTVISCYDIGLRWTVERLPLADRVIVSARQIKDELEATIQLPHEPEVVPLAVPATYVPGDLPRKPNVILFVGTEQRRKNVDGLFRIFARVNQEKPATLVKVGPPSSDRPRLEALAKDLGIQNRIVWRDFVPEEALLELYQTSSVTVVPSFLEGFSMPCLEAMSTGCPLVASNLTAIPEVVGDGGFLVSPHDEVGWAEAILRVLGDPEVSRMLSRRGIERSKAFSAVRSAERILGIYEEVSRNRGGE
jgi:glycosyltransferase involved in cell wall biosynthesis